MFHIIWSKSFALYNIIKCIHIEDFNFPYSIHVDSTVTLFQAMSAIPCLFPALFPSHSPNLCITFFAQHTATSGHFPDKHVVRSSVWQPSGIKCGRMENCLSCEWYSSPLIYSVGASKTMVIFLETNLTKSSVMADKGKHTPGFVKFDCTPPSVPPPKGQMNRDHLYSQVPYNICLWRIYRFGSGVNFISVDYNGLKYVAGGVYPLWMSQD